MSKPWLEMRSELKSSEAGRTKVLAHLGIVVLCLFKGEIFFFLVRV